ncbi:MAG: formylglycine-generating enzyme family protein [Candidatus Eremiobacteraeota bacterium]|nr:formylglycine-generating enzyme family protein [Candidatus Eremiobacteraeota bacterium]
MTQAAQLEKLSLDLGSGVKLELVKCPAGKFMMGSPETENGHSVYEGPRHEVNFTEPFYMGIYPVTREQWVQVMGGDPSEGSKHHKARFLQPEHLGKMVEGDPSQFPGKPTQPVDSVSWKDAQEFCKRVSALTGKKVHLPSEAEWEYACRAGSTARFCFGDDPACKELTEYAWFTANSNDYTYPVGQKKPNDWGIYDMHGNVVEWMQDGLHYTYEGAPTDGSSWEANHKITPSGECRMMRGGCNNSHGEGCRSAGRDWGPKKNRCGDVGFRVAASM